MASEFAILGLLLVAAIVSIAWVGEALARITRIPNIVFYLIFAILITPFLVVYRTYFFDGQIIELVISLSLAIIIFEGGYSFNRCITTVESHIPGHRRKNCKPLPFRNLIPRILRLSIIASIITAILMTLFFTYIIGFPLLLATLIGALCAITGPTVINPILRELNVKEEIAETLRGEGEVNDAIFAITSAAIFTVIALEASGIINLTLIPILIMVDLGVGILVGLGVGGIGVMIARYVRPWIIIRFNQRFDQNIIVVLDMLGLLCAALVAFSFGKLLGTEAAIIATLFAGIILGQRHRFEKIPKTNDNEEEKDLVEAEIHVFQLPLTYIALATIMVFAISFTLPNVLISAVYFHTLLLGLLAVILLMFIVRPIAVFLATIRSGFSVRERLSFSFLAPRGVIIASLSLFFALEIILHNPLGFQDFAILMVWYILIIMFVTVLVEGGLASWIAKATGIIEPNGENDETDDSAKKNQVIRQSSG